MEFIVISGLSGAGKSRVAAIMEDMDFYCVDNMPVVLIPKFVELCLSTRARYDRVALVTDIRGRESFDELFKALDEMVTMGYKYKILFVEASVKTIAKRYKETRRKHPLDPNGGHIEEAIQREMKILSRVRENADYIIDTSEYTLGMLQRRLYDIFCGDNKDRSITINVTSFGFKYGMPIDADLVYDVRFLPNPYYSPELKDKTGLDQAVKDFVFSYEQTNEFMVKILDLMKFLMPYYIEEGKPSLVIGIGCTGGRHRSVAIAEELAAGLGRMGYKTEVYHRDIKK